MHIDSKLKNNTNNRKKKFLSLKHMTRNRLDKSCSKEFRGEGPSNQIEINMIFSRCLQVLEDKGAYKAAVVVGQQVEGMRQVLLIIQKSQVLQIKPTFHIQLELALDLMTIFLQAKQFHVKRTQNQNITKWLWIIKETLGLQKTKCQTY